MRRGCHRRRRADAELSSFLAQSSWVIPQMLFRTSECVISPCEPCINTRRRYARSLHDCGMHVQSLATPYSLVVVRRQYFDRAFVRRTKLVSLLNYHGTHRRVTIMLIITII
jgi:hypothetical protein